MIVCILHTQVSTPVIQYSSSMCGLYCVIQFYGINFPEIRNDVLAVEGTTVPSLTNLGAALNILKSSAAYQLRIEQVRRTCRGFSANRQSIFVMRSYRRYLRKVAKEQKNDC
ncbi:hypothetical protein ACTXT7_013286 [Hymenolepis weldensis]